MSYRWGSDLSLKLGILMIFCGFSGITLFLTNSFEIIQTHFFLSVPNLSFQLCQETIDLPSSISLIRAYKTFCVSRQPVCTIQYNVVNACSTREFQFRHFSTTDVDAKIQHLKPKIRHRVCEEMPPRLRCCLMSVIHKNVQRMTSMTSLPQQNPSTTSQLYHNNSNNIFNNVAVKLFCSFQNVVSSIQYS